MFRRTSRLFVGDGRGQLYPYRLQLAIVIGLQSGMAELALLALAKPALATMIGVALAFGSGHCVAASARREGNAVLRIGHDTASVVAGDSVEALRLRSRFDSGLAVAGELTYDHAGRTSRQTRD